MNALLKIPIHLLCISFRQSSRTIALPSKTAGDKQGVALPGDKKWLIGSSRGLGEGGLTPRVGDDPHRREPSMLRVYITPGTAGLGPGQCLEQVTDSLALAQGGWQLLHSGNKQLNSAHKDPAAPRGHWEGAELAGAARTAQILDCWHPAGRSSHPAQAEPLCIPLGRETILVSRVLALINVLVTERGLSTV